MVHTAWTARDGAPRNINSLAQTPDGTLWFGTRDGLYSFDGLTFTAFQPVSGSMPRRDVRALFATKNGDLWAVGDGILPTRIRDGVSTLFDRVENANFVSLAFVQQSSDGTVWAILNHSKLVRLGIDGIWHIVPGARPNSFQINSFFIDSSDTQWLAADNLLYRRPRGREAFTLTGTQLFGPAKFEEAPDQTLWIAGYGQLGVERPQPLAGQPPVVALNHISALGKRLPNPLVEDDATDVAIAADGSLWVSHSGSGLQRLRPGEMNGIRVKEDANSPDTFSVSEGLTNTGDRKLLRDREGNIWSFGVRGVDRFQRATLLAAIPNAMNGWWSVCTAPNGEVWLSLAEGFLGVLRKHRLIQLKDRTNRPVEVGYEGTYSLSCDGNGNVWLVGVGGIAKVHNDRVEKLSLLPNHGDYYDSYHFTSLAVLPDHRLLASTGGPTENRLWMYEHEAWKLFLPASGITQIRTLWQDAHNNLYLGSEDGRVIVLEPPRYTVISSESSRIGPVVGFSETRYGIFAFGQDGIALQSKNRFQTLSFANQGLATSVTGLVEDRDGNIWINGSHAIARIASSELKASLSAPAHSIVAREFREGDFGGSDPSTFTRNSAQIDTEGKVWFSTSNGVVYVDPQHLDRPLPLPSLSFRSITADGRAIPATGNFPPRIENLNLRYFGLNLSDSTGVVYRYRLDGYDTSWQDVGTRNEAVYTHLRPGKFVFEVEASNGDGVWTAPLHSVPFTILPAFYQTWWFGASCIAISIFLIWMGLTWRVRYVSRSIRMRAEERADERIRIARELHDTLLQGVQGLLLSFHVAAEKVPVDHESKKTLERALTTADRIIVEGRNRVSRLRSEHLTDRELKVSLERIARDLDGNTSLEFVVERKGGSDTLQEHVVEEIFCIAREALTNAFRHSQASRVVVELDYQKRQFRFSCRDNGRGFESANWQRNDTNGHWGLRGMAERAEKIGGKFSCASSPGQGTDVQVSVPARRAYIRANGLGLFS